MRLLSLMPLVVLILLITACTASPSVPSPRSSVTTPTSVVPTSPDAATPRPTQPPPITRPLDASSYVSRPCELLTPEQQKALEMPPHDHSGPGDVVANCDWRSKQPDVTVLVHLYLVDSPFTAAYQEPDSPATWGTFEEVTIKGQPAVVRTVVGKPDTGCDVVVGISETQGIRIVASTDFESGVDSVDWCAKAKGIADAIVENLSG